MQKISQLAKPGCPNRRYRNCQPWRLGSGGSIYEQFLPLQLLILLLLLITADSVAGQRNVNCYFNQLCSCKLSPSSFDESLSSSSYYSSSHGDETSTTSNKESTTPTFQGQFGVILSDHSVKKFDDETSSRSRNNRGGAGRPASGGRPMALINGSGSADKQNIREISCIGVPFFKSPDLPSVSATHVDLVNAGLEILGNNILSGTSLETVRFMDNKISFIDNDAFREVGSTLKSLDLSYNQLSEFPATSLSRLEALDWLNLHGNDISVLNEEITAPFKITVSTLFLGENDLGQVSPKFFSTFKRLLWLNLDNNHIREFQANSLPVTLVTLSVTNNYIAKFPMDLVNSLPSLTWFTLRGNYIETLPVESFSQLKRLDKLDLGENFITTVPSGIFNKTLHVNDLNLDYNYIEHIGERAFQSVVPRRLYLGHNRITNMHNNTFEGVENSLELIDLEGNRLNEVTPSFGDLKQLRYLFLSNNNISALPVDTFDKLCQSLKALSVSANQLQEFPRQALKRCSSLAHLNIGYNKIGEIVPDDFANWAGDLDTLILRNNMLTHLDARVFRACPKLRELSLSYNRFDHIDTEAFRDVALSLESLEISFGLQSRLFPEYALKPLQRLLWLALDNNELEEISETALYSLGELQYLNLESNNLGEIVPNLLHKNVHKNLIDVRLSYNRLTSIKSNTFNGLIRLQTIVLAGNIISNVETEAFKHMQKLSTISLISNRLSSVASRAFVQLDSLQKLELQFNSLREFSLEAFDNCSTNWDTPMTLNVSHNALQSLTANNPDDKKRSPPPFIRILDASHNELNQVPKSFLDAISPALLTVDLSFNRIVEVDSSAFKRLSRLQELRMAHNQIEDLQKNSIKQLTGLQILDLSYNQLEVLQFGQFSGLSALRIVVLSHNRLRSLPRDIFQGSSVESVDLSSNEFVAMPTSALTEVSAHLRHLNLSFNAIEHLDSTMFANMPHLMSLSFAHNRLTVLPDNIFAGIGGLRHLDLSSNPLRANFKSLLHYVRRLTNLKLSAVELDLLPVLQLPQLTSLDISNNRLSDISTSAIEGVPRLRHLNLSRNQLLRLPAHIWPSIPYLKSLDVSWNPLRVLTKESFQGLLRLQDLFVRYLPDLKRFDADSLSHLHYLTNLAIQSWPSIEKYKFRLGSVVSGLAPLRTLSARILERSGVLTDQILGAFGPKLKELELSGPLHTITADAFEGIESYELKLTIRDTNIRSLPEGFIDMFANVAHLTLDLSQNKLETLSPDFLYEDPNHWEQKGTQVLKGGLALQGNPWQCTCENAWLGRWLRRWMRETLELHLNVAERNQNIQTLVRSISCNLVQEEKVELFQQELSESEGQQLTAYSYGHDNEESYYNDSSTRDVTRSNNNGLQRPLVELNKNIKCQKKALPVINLGAKTSLNTVTFWSCLLFSLTFLVNFSSLKVFSIPMTLLQGQHERS